MEEFDYVVKYVRDADNVKADALSRNSGASLEQPSSRFEEKIYSILDDKEAFRQQLFLEQVSDAFVRSTRDSIIDGVKITQGRLKAFSRSYVSSMDS